ncbi:MAG: hypothetical protein N2442_06815 [Spirochaetes bacterium]|nr:hypothetical protein [Spirochaetota bacterium]
MGGFWVQSWRGEGMKGGVCKGLLPGYLLGSLLGFACGFLGFFASLSSCARPPHIEPILIDPATLRPPQLVAIQAGEGNMVELRFDKSAWIDPDSIRIQPALLVRSLEDGNTVCRLYLDGKGIPGKKYTLEARTRDEKGNTSEFLYGFYGFNDRIPRLLINEFITISATTVLTQVEIAVLSDGNMGGVTFYEGTKNVPDKTFLFPPFEVKAGEYILLHFKPEGTPGEIDETTDKKVATGKGASPTAYDFWAQGTGNLSEDNDVLSLYSNPEGKLLDAVLYSSKVFETGMRYNGFGTSAMLEKVLALKEEEGWTFAGTDPYPSDAVNPKGATSRRSICRDSRFTDTNSKSDWHIVPSGSATFGAVNSDAIYIP